MSESKLRTQSMDFAVSIINLVKFLKKNGSPLFLIKSAEAAQVSAPIFVKRSMLTAKLIL